MSNKDNMVVGSPSLEDPDYWWFTVRSKLLSILMEDEVKRGDLVLDVGSADGPSAAWLKKKANCLSMDLDPRGLESGGVVGSVMNIPFSEASFDGVSAFDVIEHCSDEELALSEIYRVLKPGGYFLMSVPAYEWAWTSFDAKNAHHRRYNRKRVRRGLEHAGFTVEKLSHGFAGVMPFFAADRLRTRFLERNLPPQKLGEGELPPLPAVNSTLESLFKKMSKLDEVVLTANKSLPFGSSVFAVARKPR